MIRKLRPGKRNRAMAQEAANPKTKLAGTAMTAAMVSFMAERATGSTIARENTRAFGERIDENRKKRNNQKER